MVVAAAAKKELMVSMLKDTLIEQVSEVIAYKDPVNKIQTQSGKTINALSQNGKQRMHNNTTETS